jgi:hypothetical protein
MKSEAKATLVVEEARGLIRETFDIQGRLHRNPYGMMVGAVGIGFVLGGGLFTRLTERILGAGLRVALTASLPILERQIVHAFTESKLNTPKENDQ